MDRIFYSIYNYFQGRKFLLFVLILFIILNGVYFGSKISLEEDILKLMPTKKGHDDISYVMNNIKKFNNVIIHISNSSENNSTDPEILIDAANELSDSIKLQLVPDYVNSVALKIEEERFVGAYNSFYSDLALFLKPKYYEGIEQKLNSDSISAKIAKNYRVLMSPAGIVMRKFLLDDPLSLTLPVINSLKQLKTDGNLDLYNGYLITNDRKGLIFFIEPAFPSSETYSNAIMLENLDNIIDAVEKKYKGEVNITYFGAAPVAVSNAECIKSDVTFTVSLAIALLFLLIIYYFRNPIVLPTLLLPIILGTIAGIVIIYFALDEISAISLGIGSVLLGICIDYSLHVFTHFRISNDINKVFKNITNPLLLSSLTTSAAFLCLLIMSSEALRDLGLFAAISVMLSAICALIFLPQFLGLFKIKKLQKNNIIEKISAFEIDRKMYVVIPVILLTVYFFFFTGMPEFDSDLNKLNFMSEKLKKSEAELNNVTSLSFKSVYIVTKGKNLDEALDNSYPLLNNLKAMKEKSVIGNFTSAASVLPSKNAQKKNIEKWNSFWNGSRKNAVLSYIKNAAIENNFKEGAFKKFDSLLTKKFMPVNLKNLAENLSFYSNGLISEAGGKTFIINIIKVKPENIPEFYSNLEQFDDIVVVDMGYLAKKFIEILKDDFDSLVILSFIIVFLILLISFGRIELALISIVPMIVSWIWTLGIMYLLGINFTIFNIIISTFIFGLGIDYSIFILRGLQQEFKLGEKTIRSYKVSILLSSLTTLIGLGVLFFADHPALISISLTSIIGISSVLLISFTIEPVLFRFVAKTEKTGVRPYTLLNIIFTINSHGIFLTGSLIFSLLAALINILPINKNKLKPMFHKLVRIGAWMVIYGSINVKKSKTNEHLFKPESPSIIICNHQSVIDILYILSISPKLVLLTNEWVWNSPIFGRIVQFLDFYPVTSGVEKSLESLGKLIDEGYSLVVFPEGTRSKDSKIKRFHKGAFYLAEQLKLEIRPIIFHGIGESMKKGDLTLNSGSISINYMPAIPYNDNSYGVTYSEKTKNIRRAMIKEYEIISQKVETCSYHKDRLIKNFIYKGPVLEWYLRVKLRLENYYDIFHKIVPESGKIYDIGCGYGFMGIMLAFKSGKRQITGIDYDKEKILTAKNCRNLPGNIEFEHSDATGYDFKFADCFVISDIMHYLTPDNQQLLLDKCTSKLNPGGKIVIRDGDSKLAKRDKGTKLSEFFSTNIGFNKTVNELAFFSEDDLINKMKPYSFKCEIIDRTRFTSNKIYIFTKHE